MFNTFSVDAIRKDFPLLHQKVIYFDTACMSLKPQCVIDRVVEYYSQYTACGGRSAHSLAMQVADRVQHTRDTVKNFLHAGSSSEIVLTKNTTEGLNIVASGLSLKKGDEVVLSDKEHNSNLLPWLRLREHGVTVKIVESNPDTTFNLERFEEALTKSSKLVSLVHTSNIDGVTNPLKEIVKISHDHDALVCVDAAQSVPHCDVDVKRLDVDFLAFSGHKVLGPTGTGVLYGKKELLEVMQPAFVGGGTVVDSTFDGYILDHSPVKFEAGLQDYAGIIALADALDYVKKVGFATIEKHVKRLNTLMTESLLPHSRLRLLGPEDPALRGNVFSFIPKDMDIHVFSNLLDSSKKILTRSGAHCVHAWFNKHHLKGSVRASLYFYNTEEEVKTFVDEVKKILQLG